MHNFEPDLSNDNRFYSKWVHVQYCHKCTCRIINTTFLLYSSTVHKSRIIVLKTFTVHHLRTLCVRYKLTSFFVLWLQPARTVRQKWPAANASDRCEQWTFLLTPVPLVTPSNIGMCVFLTVNIVFILLLCLCFLTKKTTNNACCAW
jgi:hypothetical protein